MYTVISTYPELGTQNVGDRLLTETAKKLVDFTTNEANEFTSFFRETALDDALEQVNSSKGVLLPGFALRPTTYPNTYRLTKNLEDIKVPIIPIGIGTKFSFGKDKELEDAKLDKGTRFLLDHIYERNQILPAREFVTHSILKRNGYENIIYTGDLGYFDPTCIGRQFKLPNEIKKVAFTTPHNGRLVPQAKRVLSLLKTMFGGAKLYFVNQSKAGSANHQHDFILQDFAQSLGYEVLDTNGDLDGIENTYTDFDLHVGYRCHGHIMFLRNRIPSFLIAEDSRGAGFLKSLGRAMGLPAFALSKASFGWKSAAKLIVRKDFNQAYSMAPDNQLDIKLGNIIEQEINAQFINFKFLGEQIDTVFNDGMMKYLKTILK